MGSANPRQYEDDWRAGDRVIYHRRAGKPPTEKPDLPHESEGSVVPPKEDTPKGKVVVFFVKHGEVTIDSSWLERIL